MPLGLDPQGWLGPTGTTVGHRWCPGLILGLAVMLMMAVTANDNDADGEDQLVGWQGETYSQARGGGAGMTAPWIETLSWSPRVFFHHSFLTHAECDHLVGVGSTRLKRSMVVDAAGVGAESETRTSYSGWFKRGEDPVVAAIEERLAVWSQLPAENGEPIQVLRYNNGQINDFHFDVINDLDNLDAGKRYATVLMYLGEVEEGGETVFPRATPIDAEAQLLDNPSECAEDMPVAVKPRKGDALLFFDTDIQGQETDKMSLHGSCPPLKGTKWTATKWIHANTFWGQFNALEAAANCTDTASDCSSKASEGLCRTDPSLVGLLGSCRRTCGDCIQCPQDDIACYRSNIKGRSVQAPRQRHSSSGSSSTSSSSGGSISTSSTSSRDLEQGALF